MLDEELREISWTRFIDSRLREMDVLMIRQKWCLSLEAVYRSHYKTDLDCVVHCTSENMTQPEVTVATENPTC